MDNHNVSNPEFWNNLYKTDVAKWDLGCETPFFKSWIKKLSMSQKICVLGCGNGYDAIEFAKRGHKVVAIDFSSIAIGNIESKIRNTNLDIIIKRIDLFHLNKIYNEYFDYVVEYTCFCAIDPSKRINYRNVVYSILKKDWIFASLFFPIKDGNNSSPPFHVNLMHTLKLFEEKFNLISKYFPENSIKQRLKNEIFCELKK